MQLALIGYGKMGHMVEAIALSRAHVIAAKIDPGCSQKMITQESLNGIDVCIDFSHPDQVLDNIRNMAKLGLNMVVGTTGWYDRLDEVEKIVSRANVGLLYSPNFSIGVNLFFQIVSAAADLINGFADYDVGMIESHHNQKADSPSGTAQMIARQLLQRISRKKQIIHNLESGAVPPDAIHVASLRCGAIPGTHSVVFDSRADTITLTHEARNREGFALGAVLAAEWLTGKKGIYTLNDMLEAQ